MLFIRISKKKKKTTTVRNIFFIKIEVLCEVGLISMKILWKGKRF